MITRVDVWSAAILLTVVALNQLSPVGEALGMRNDVTGLFARDRREIGDGHDFRKRHRQPAGKMLIAANPAGAHKTDP